MPRKPKTRGPGRPAHPLTERFMLRASPEQLKRWRRIAKASKVPVGDWCRYAIEAACGGPVVVP